MEGPPHALIEELRRAIAQTPDTAEQKALFEKLGLLEVELAELARRQRAVHDADERLAQAKSIQLGWRAAIVVLVAALVGLSAWLLANIWQAF